MLRVRNDSFSHPKIYVAGAPKSQENFILSTLIIYYKNKKIYIL